MKTGRPIKQRKESIQFGLIFRKAELFQTKDVPYSFRSSPDLN